MKIQAKTRNILLVTMLLALGAALALFLATGNSDTSGQAEISGGEAVTVATTATAAKTATNAAGALNGSGMTGAAATVDSLTAGSAGSGPGGSAEQSSGGGSGGGSGQPAPQSTTIGLKPGNIFLYTHQDNEFHNLVAGLPVDFTVNVQLWIPGNNNQILTINQPASVWVEYWKSPGGAKQTANLSHWKNDQGSAWWVMSIPPLAPGSYEARAYAATSDNTVSITGVFTINNN